MPLPVAARHKLEQTLGQWRHWQCDPALPGAPHIVELLTPGISNHSVLVAASERRFVVRIDGSSPACNGINRQSEWHTLRHAHQAGLAPCPRYFNPELGSLVCDYLEPDPQQPQSIEDTAQLLQRIHQLPVSHHRLDLGERIRRYERQADRDGSGTTADLAAVRDAVLAQLAILQQGKQALVQCHNDLLAANRLNSSGRLWALDWEYSAMASPWCDLAFVAAGDSLTPTETDTLLQYYLQRPPRPEESLTLVRTLCVCRFIEILWYLAQPHTGLDAQGLAEKLAALESELGRINP